MKHVVSKSDLEGFKVEQVVCGNFPKKLTLLCDPIINFICFKVESNREVVGIYGNIDDALEHYNSF